MLIPEDLMDFIAAEPFRPFQIRMASGRSFDIRYPERINVGRTSLSVYSAIGTDQNAKWHQAPLALIETIESL